MNGELKLETRESGSGQRRWAVRSEKEEREEEEELKMRS